MAGFLCTRHILDRYGDEIRAAAADTGIALDVILLPSDPAERLPAETLAAVDLSFFSGDVVPDYGRSYFAATQGAPNLKWMHTMNAGLDNPVFGRLLAKGVTITTSSGSTAVPIAQTAIGGLLMLSRPFLAWGESQRRSAWEPREGKPPADLATETLVVFGLGAIGREIARLGRALGLHVIGVRRSPRAEGDSVDEMVTPAALAEVLPRANWLALACPLTEKTRGVIDAAAIAALPAGARILNVARGEVIDQDAMIAALRAGHLGGAYLDVTTPEPLPPDSPLWTLPNVIISPHNSAVAAGNERRQVDMFLANLRRWGRGEPMVNASS
ncbi:MAG: D-2-hydroxyacid dehydrogenase [Dehalococcoidia bacterium]|nr:D-2-hydroxyacid dehydrogenase [Dehalococcoidia bacterium]